MKQVWGVPWTEYMPALGLACITLAFLITGYTYQADARVFPVAVAWGLLAMIALDITSRTDTSAGRAVTKWLNPGVSAAKETPSAWAQASAMLWLAAFALMMILIGVTFAIPVYLFASLRFRAQRSLLLSFVITAIASATIWLLFSQVLRLELYPGYLFGGVN